MIARPAEAYAWTAGIAGFLAEEFKRTPAPTARQVIVLQETVDVSTSTQTMTMMATAISDRLDQKTDLMKTD